MMTCTRNRTSRNTPPTNKGEMMKILVGYKGLNMGKDLLEIALKHAKAFGGEVLVVTSRKGKGKIEPQKIQIAEENSPYTEN